MTHAKNCRWERTTPAECAYRDTHHYCPHSEHACNCPPIRDGGADAVKRSPMPTRKARIKPMRKSRVRVGSEGFCDRFWSYVSIGSPTECWPWKGGTVPPEGYGCFDGGERRTLRAHQVAWMRTSGCNIPKGRIIMHSCDNPPCCNPAHLSCGTHSENVLDAIQKGRFAGPTPRFGADHHYGALTHCRKGHPFSGDNLELTKKGHRRCRACRRARRRKAE